MNDDFGFPISGTEYWIVRARPHVRTSKVEGFLVPHWFVAHPSDLDNHLFMLGEATDLRDPYPPSYLEEKARKWVAENAATLRPPPRPS